MIPTYILDRIRKAQPGGERLATLLAQLATAIEQMDLPGGVIRLDFTEAGDPLEPGDLIPSITLTLQKVPDAEETAGPPAPETTA